MNKDEKDKIYYRFIRGESVDSIAKEIGMSWSKTFQIIDNKLPVANEFSDEEIANICQLYLDGLSTTKIGELYKVSHKFVIRVLDDHHIDRKRNGVRKHSLDENYFDTIDTQNKAYILGFLFADGYNGMNKSTIRLQLSECDYEILEKIRLELKSDKPLHYVDCSNRVYGNGYITKNMYSLEFYGKHICERLDELGMHQNKSLILKYPDNINPELNRHFIRGYFDGDGSFYHGYGCNFTITSTQQFCEECLKIIRLNTGIKGGSIFDASCHNGITKYISISGSKNCKVVLDWLYQDSELYLQRKYDKYITRFYSDAA